MVAKDSTLTPELVDSWIKDIKARVSEIRDTIGPLQDELKLLYNQLEPLHELRKVVELEENYEENYDELVNESQETPSERLRRQILEVLSDYGRPMRIVEIFDEFDLRGYKLPGNGSVQTFRNYFYKWDKIICLGGGFWAVQEEKAEASVSSNDATK